MYSKEIDSTVQNLNMLLRAIAGQMNKDTQWTHVIRKAMLVTERCRLDIPII